LARNVRQRYGKFVWPSHQRRQLLVHFPLSSTAAIRCDYCICCWDNSFSTRVTTWHIHEPIVLDRSLSIPNLTGSLFDS
jgi:hypothetical protein